MLYFLPDSNDKVDLTYDFAREYRSRDRITRDDSYCHEVLGKTYDGILISAANVLAKSSTYSAATRRRLMRDGVRNMFRAPSRLKFMGDCGAFAYAKEHEPPYSVVQIADFYDAVGVDFGLAVDHIVPGFSHTAVSRESADAEAVRRYDLTLALAQDFIEVSRGRKFVPIGVVQGWDARSMIESAKALQRMGYTYIALGGVVRLRDAQLLALVESVNSVREPGTRLHLLGIARSNLTEQLVGLGVTSIDSTSPLRRAWMDSTSNYQFRDSAFMALRVPPSLSPKIRARVESGELCCTRVTELETRAMVSLQEFDNGARTVQQTLDALLAYQDVHSPKQNRRAGYTRTLSEKPWARCVCEVCTRLGHHVIMLRGAERNRSRGFHNVAQFYRRFLSAHGEPDMVLLSCGAAKLAHAATAETLYTGSLFKAHARIATRYRAPIRILSAKHGLLDARQVLEPYDCALTKMTRADRHSWSVNIARSVRSQLPNGGTVVVLAGAAYKDWVDMVPEITVVDPLKGLTLGQRLHYAKPAIIARCVFDDEGTLT